MDRPPRRTSTSRPRSCSGRRRRPWLTVGNPGVTVPALREHHDECELHATRRALGDRAFDAAFDHGMHRRSTSVAYALDEQLPQAVSASNGATT